MFFMILLLHFVRLVLFICVYVYCLTLELFEQAVPKCINGGPPLGNIPKNNPVDTLLSFFACNPETMKGIDRYIFPGREFQIPNF